MDNVFVKRKKQISQVFRKCSTFCGQNDYRVSEEVFAELTKSFQERKLMVVVAGEARRGKSSLLNALLDLEENVFVFPVDIDICTNVVTIVQYGEEEKVEVLIEDEKAESGVRVEMTNRAGIKGYVTEAGNPGNYRKVKMLNAYMPSKILKDGVVFVDTPGVGSLNVEHAEVTYGFLPQADLLLFVGDSSAGFTESELKLLQRGYGFCKNVLFPLTKIDLNAQYKDIMESNRTKISKILEIPEEEIGVIPVSSASKLDYLESHDEFMYEMSNFSELEAKIWGTIAGIKESVFFQPYIETAEEEIGKLRDRVTTEYQMIASGDSGKAAELTKEWGKIQKKLESLHNDGTGWQNDLNKLMINLSSDLQLIQSEGRQEVNNIIEDYFMLKDRNICEERYYNELLETINDSMAITWIKIRRMIDDNIGNSIASLNESTGLAVINNQETLEKIGFKPKGDLAVAFPQRKKSDKLIKGGTEVRRNVVGGGMVGTVGGAVVFGALGFLVGGPALALGAGKAGAILGGSLGGFAGGAKGAIDSVMRADPEDINILRKAINNYYSSCFNQIQSDSRRYLDLSKNAITQSFKEELNRRSREYKDAAESLKNNLTTARTEEKTVLMKIKNQADQLDGLRKELEGLYITNDIEFSEVNTGKKAEPNSNLEHWKGKKKSSEVNSYAFLQE